MKHITFYFDVISPYAALAFERLPEALQGHSVVGKEGHLRFLAGHRVRVVRLLPVRLAGRPSSPPSSSRGSIPTSAYIFALLAFAAGFLVRPFGAIVFGRLGDMIGRKYTFLVTILIMGASTFIVGLLPSYASIGIAAR
jgi:MFS family permease